MTWKMNYDLQWVQSLIVFYIGKNGNNMFKIQWFYVSDMNTVFKWLFSI